MRLSLGLSTLFHPACLIVIYTQLCTVSKPCRILDTPTPVVCSTAHDSGYSNSSPSPHSTWQRLPPRQRPPTITDLQDPGWVPKAVLEQQQRCRRPRPAPVPHVPVSPPSAPSSSYHHQPIRHEQPEAPAWLGSLRPSVESKASDMRISGLQSSVTLNSFFP